MRFWDDTRSQSVQIGVVLLLGMAVIAFSTYQATVIPSQNSEVELNHFQDVRNDMVEVRNSILTTGQTDVEQHPSVTLGTNYPPRIAGLNPPSASGTLRTSDTYNITITNESGAQVELPTRFLEYSPEYNQLRSGSTWYENSVLYLDEREQGGSVVIIEEQNLLVGGNSLRIVALQGDIGTGGTRRITLDLFPAENITADEIPTGELTIQIPTRLTGGEYWDTAFANAPPGAYQGVNESSYPGESSVYGLELNINTSPSSTELQINTVGIQSDPSNNPQKQNVGATGSGSGGGGSGSGGDNGGSGGSGDPLPSSDTSFDDENGNGVYDSSETSYSEQDIVQGFDQTGVDLVIAEDVTDSSGLDVKADSIAIQDGVTLESTNNDVKLESYNGDIVASGSVSAKNSIEFTTSGNDIDASSGAIDTQNGKVTFSTDSGGNLNIAGSSVTAKNEIKLNTSGGGNIDASGSAINTQNGKIELSTDGGGNLDVSGSSVTAKNEIKLDTSGTGDIDASGSTIDTESGKIELITSGNSEIDLRSAVLRSKNNAYAADNNAATIYVDNGRVEESNGNEGTLYVNGEVNGSLAFGAITYE